MVCMYGYTYSKSMNQPDKVANPARGQLNRENGCFPFRVCAWEFGLARRVRQSRPAQPAHSSHSGLNLVLAYGILPEFRGGVHLFIKNRHTPSGQSRVYRVTQLRTDGIHCREYVGTRPVNLEVGPNESSAALAGHHEPTNMRLSFPHPLLVISGHVESTGKLQSTVYAAAPQ